MKIKDPFQYRWLVFLVIAHIYFFVWLHRVSPTVIASDLVSAFGADATALGFMSSSYFYLYAFVQPPVGFLADTLGSRRVITLATFVACAGAVIFGTASNMVMATIGRALIGAGAGGVFVPALKIFSRWYKANEFASMTGTLLAVGGIGGLSASLPLAYLVAFLGWRLSFLAIGTVSFGLALLCWTVVREKPEDKGWKPIAVEDPPLRQNLAGPLPFPPLSKRLHMVLGKPEFWMVTLSLFFSGGSLMTFQGLWAIPYLMDVYHHSRVQAGGWLMMIPVGFIIGAPTFGFFTDRFALNPRGVLLFALGLGLSCWIVIVLTHSSPPIYLLSPLFLMLGACAGSSTALYMTIMKELFPVWLTGTAVGLLNTAAFLSTAVFQPLTGFLMDVVGKKGLAYPLEAYRLVFVTSLACMGVALLVIFFLSSPRREA